MRRRERRPSERPSPHRRLRPARRWTSAGAPDGGRRPGSSGAAGPIPAVPRDPDHDPYSDEPARNCAAGDLEECDRLHSRTPVGSEYASYGSTCGFGVGTGHRGRCAVDFD